jgi:hypothetical protein
MTGGSYLNSSVLNTKTKILTCITCTFQSSFAMNYVSNWLTFLTFGVADLMAFRILFLRWGEMPLIMLLMINGSCNALWLSVSVRKALLPSAMFWMLHCLPASCFQLSLPITLKARFCAHWFQSKRPSQVGWCPGP